MSTTFSIPREIVTGAGALDRLSTLEGVRAVLVTGGRSMKRFGFLDTAIEKLQIAGMETIIIDGVEPNPSVKTVINGAQIMIEFEPDWIVAIGGGSALDAAKIMWCFYEHPELSFTDILPVGSMPPLRKKAKFIAIPSTSGTASEITAFSVITDTENHIKYPLVSGHMVPDIAILDPALPSTMPPHITANTGMDALCHAIEAIASTAANSFSDPLAIEAIQLVFDNLLLVYKEPTNMVARERMHNASALAGMAFSNVSLGLVHSLAHKIGGEFGITHGLANAILLPYIIRYNRLHTHKYEMVEKQLGILDLATEVEKLNEKLGIPNSLREVTEVKIEGKAFHSVLRRMSLNALNDPCTLTNPGYPTLDIVIAIYLQAYYGNKIHKNMVGSSIKKPILT